MRASGLSLQHIRTHDHYTVKFEQPTTILLGANASGKTTIIESLYLLATGDSFRAQKIEEMIAFGKELGRVKGIVVSESERTELEIILTRGEVQGKRTARRLFSVNGVRRRKSEATKSLQAVVFRPEDMRLVEGSPARRRTYLDEPLKSVHAEYARSLKTYEQTLRRRNRLLQQVREGEQPRTVLQYWNNALIKHGEIIQRHRSAYLRQAAAVPFAIPFTVEYQPSVISQERQEQYVGREIAAGHTLIGPHKDDLAVRLLMEGEQREVAVYGSRGQQRLAVLWLKFVEFAYLETHTHQQPLLLLDDILSELDEDSRHLSLEVVRHCQSVISTTEPEVVTLLQEALPADTIQVVKL